MRRPVADVLRLGRPQCDRRGGGESLQAHEGVAVHRQRSLGEPTLDLQVLEVTGDVAVGRAAVARVTGSVHGAGSSRVSAALATSPMRTRNSVPMSAL